MQQLQLASSAIQTQTASFLLLVVLLAVDELAGVVGGSDPLRAPFFHAFVLLALMKIMLLIASHFRGMRRRMLC